MFVLVESDDDDSPDFEAEDQIGMEANCACFTTGIAYCLRDTGREKFFEKLIEFDNARKSAIETVRSRYGTLTLNQILEEDDVVRHNIEESIILQRGGFSTILKCWDSINQTSDLSQAIADLDVDSTFWLLEIKLID